MTIDYDPSRTALYSPEQREADFLPGQAYSLQQIAVEAARLAYFRAERSPAQRARRAEALSRVGFAGLTLFTDRVTGAAAFGAHRGADGVTLLALRGTQPDNFADIATDLQANMVAWPETTGRVHAGFAAATRALRPQIQRWFDDTRPQPAKLVLTGSSLGAAMATLAATLWRPGWLVTLGSPRVGDADFVATVTAPITMRIVNCCDAVTEVPLAIGGYTHLATRTYVTRDGSVLDSPADALVDADRRAARLEYPGKYALGPDAALFRDVADHAPINYARAVLP